MLALDVVRNESILEMENLAKDRMLWIETNADSIESWLDNHMMSLT